jgi:flagellar FliJ protein
MMKKSQRMKMLVELKAQQEKNALKSLGFAQKKLSDIEAQVDNLLRYRKEYLDNFNQVGGNGIQIAQLVEFRSFIEKLDQAIAGHEKLLASSREELRHKRQTWEGMHHKTESLQKIMDSAHISEYQEEMRREQRQADEGAGRFKKNNKSGL